ncbi:MAG: CehA/McbA family metallohydrolase [Anaerolineae bacterium]|nr:CehA/McbA family metallohydrolase [Anaerolineae bacterium]
MASHEYVGNLHIHTPYSDGAAYHAAVADAALLAELDFLVFTDHNVRVSGIEGYYGDEERGYTLLLTGEEVHDRTRNPQCNHLLVYDTDNEVSAHAHDLTHLIDTVRKADGMSFIAHPDDHAVKWIGEPAIPWLDRYVDGFTGLEIWNTMSRFKDHIQTKRETIRAIFRPEDVMTGPHPLTLALWDQLLAMGHRVVGIGNADAHGTTYSAGPISHTIFPYDFLFSCVNTHLLTKAPLIGNVERDKTLLYQSLRRGRAFIGYEIPGPTCGFRFTAQGQSTAAIMGESIRLGHGVTLQAYAPDRARIKIIRHGDVVAEDTKTQNLTHVARESGAYRVEVWREYHGTERAWILSNPIYVED